MLCSDRGQTHVYSGDHLVYTKSRLYLGSAETSESREHPAYWGREAEAGFVLLKRKRRLAKDLKAGYKVEGLLMWPGEYHGQQACCGSNPEVWVLGPCHGGQLYCGERGQQNVSIARQGKHGSSLTSSNTYAKSWDLMPRTLEGQITMEKTPSYFVTREAPARISAMSKDTKLIVVVRDPVTRAISDYTQTLSKRPDIPTFESLTFKNRTTGLIDTSWSAIQIGIYAKHLEHWLHHFPIGQMLFVSGERLISDPAGELGRVQDFLGLKRIITDKHFYFNKTKGFPCLKKAEGSSKPHCLGKTKGRTHPAIDREVVRRLREFYRPFNLKFYQMTGQDFGWDG
ncbi:hypothetical protein GH733_018744 [Mirounga leonina]|nr:hypothetical protein GH733_018744 [Mirounga leonina]